jgi:hypothetical protein
VWLALQFPISRPPRAKLSPTGAALGTIILANGGGTTLFNAGFANAYLANAYLKNGFRVVQLLWASNWEDSNGVGVTSAACRPATIPPPPVRCPTLSFLSEANNRLQEGLTSDIEGSRGHQCHASKADS